MTNKPNCGFYRETPTEHQCLEGNCYYGDTEEIRKFGNCCYFCNKVQTCEGRCSFMSEIH